MWFEAVEGIDRRGLVAVVKGNVCFQGFLEPFHHVCFLFVSKLTEEARKKEGLRKDYPGLFW